MAKDALQTVIDNWTKRTSTLAGMGVTPDKFSQLAQTDINKVARGGTGLTDQEVYDAALSGANNQPVIQDPQKSTSPLSILGNAVPDIQGILEGAPKGIFNLFRHAPSEATNLGHYVANTLGRSGASERGWEQNHGYEDSSGMSLRALAAGFRNVTKNPLVSTFAPGVSDIAQATTSAGRKNMERHPVGSLLDIVPDAPKELIGEVGARALYGDAEGARAAGVAAGEGGLLAQDTWQTKLASGHPAAALIRSIEPLNEVRIQFLQRFHLDPESLMANRRGNEIKGATAIKQKRLIDTITSVLPRDAEGNIDDEALARISQEHEDPRLLEQSPTPEADQAILNLMRERDHIATDVAKASGDLRSVEFNGKEELYSTEGAGGRVLSAYDHMLSLENQVALKRQEIDSLQAAHLDKFGHDPQPPVPGSPREASLKAINARTKTLNKLMKSLKSAQKDYATQLHDTAPARFQPMIANDLRDQVRAKLQSVAPKMQGGDAPLTDPESGLTNSLVGLKEAFSDLEMGRMDRIFSQEVGWFTPEHWADMYREAERTWQDMSKAGYDPQWVHNTDLRDLQSLNSVKPLSHAAKPSMVKDRTLNLAPKLSDWGAALSVAAHEYLRMRASEEYIQTVLVPQSMSLEQVMREIEPEASKLMLDAKRTVSKALIKKDLLEQHYQRISSDMTGGIVTPTLKPIMDKELYIPRHLAEASREFTSPKAHGNFARALQGGNKVYMTSVLAFNPTFIAKHLITGTVSLLGRSGYEEFLPENLAKAWHMATNAEELMPIQLSQRLDTMTEDDITSWLAGTKHGAILRAAGKAAGFNYKIANLVMNMQRSMAFLGEEARNLKEGYTPEAARELGLVHANKVFVDLNGMLPVERNAIRLAIPFYSFTKQILRYALTYPIDHPYRASIIANLGEMEQQDWTSGLPRSFMDLFFFGKGDNKAAINFATLDPYRDVGNYFTLTGLISSLNPLAQGTLTAAGLNTLSATPELYPSVTYNPDTGKLESKRPGYGPLSMLQSVIPEVGTLDHFLQLSSSMRTLAATNSTNYRRQLFSSLGLPYVPYNVNIPYSAEQAELNRFKYAQGQVAQTMKSGDISSIKNLNLVPYLDQLYTPDQLQAIIQQMTGQAQQVSLPGLVGPESIKAISVKPKVVKGAAQLGAQQAEQYQQAQSQLQQGGGA
jgi:hypothetical protein